MLNATYPLVPFVTGTGQDMIFFILSPLGVAVCVSDLVWND